MNCMSCEKEVQVIYRSTSVLLQWDPTHPQGPRWVEKEVYSNELSCVHCYEPITYDELAAAGMPLPID